MLTQIELADFLALMMVLATIFSAYATWRTARIADSIYLAAERAYFGIESMTFNDSRSNDPRIVIDYRNLGNVTAMRVKMLRRMTIDGAEVTAATKFTRPGILSPSVPHFAYFHLQPAIYARILAGQSSLVIQIAVEYTNPRLQLLCYTNTYTYDPGEQTFNGSGGSLDCADQRGIWPDSVK